MKHIKKLSKNLLSTFLVVNTTHAAKKLIDENDVITEKLAGIIVNLDMSQDLLGNIGYRPDCSQISSVTGKDILRISDLINIISKEGICTNDDFTFNTLGDVAETRDFTSLGDCGRKNLCLG